MLTRITIFPVSNYKHDDIYRNKNSIAFLQTIPGHHHPFPRLSMTLAVFHDFPGLENGLTKFHDFPGRVVTLPHCQHTGQVPLTSIPTGLFCPCGILFHVCYVQHSTKSYHSVHTIKSLLHERVKPRYLPLVPCTS